MKRFLFTTLPTNDFGLLSRSLPIARELTLKGHEVIYCHPAKGPQILISEAGFKNILPDDPLYYVMADPSLRGLPHAPGKGKLLQTLKTVAENIWLEDITNEWWNADQMTPLENSAFSRASVEALTQIMESSKADAIVDFWNPWACIAAKICKKPLIAVIQYHLHPQSPGIIYWRDPPKDLPTSVPNLNILLDQYGLPQVKSLGDLYAGSLTLVVGLPELDPLPETAEVTYIGALLWQHPEARLPGWITSDKIGKPIVWLYPGTLRYAGKRPIWGDSESVLQASAEALIQNHPI